MRAAALLLISKPTRAHVHMRQIVNHLCALPSFDCYDLVWLMSKTFKFLRDAMSNVWLNVTHGCDCQAECGSGFSDLAWRDSSLMWLVVTLVYVSPKACRLRLNPPFSSPYSHHPLLPWHARFVCSLIQVWVVENSSQPTSLVCPHSGQSFLFCCGVETPTWSHKILDHDLSWTGPLLWKCTRTGLLRRRGLSLFRSLRQGGSEMVSWFSTLSASC